jgi:hypothetical protein
VLCRQPLMGAAPVINALLLEALGFKVFSTAGLCCHYNNQGLRFWIKLEIGVRFHTRRVKWGFCRSPC